MAYDVVDNPAVTPVTDIPAWLGAYKEQNLELSQDQSMLTLANPDDSLIVIGPPRIGDKDASEFHLVGMVNQLTYTESAQVQPYKAIGSRRHAFSRTNTPVQGNIARAMFLGKNLYRALYAVTDTDKVDNVNAKFTTSSTNDSWYANLEEDLFRIPIGIGIIYMAPIEGATEGTKVIGADYLEAVTLVNRSVSVAQGQALIMEQVSFMADRVVPWEAYTSGLSGDTLNPAGEIA